MNRITADMVESSEFPQLVQRYDVYGVPKTVINETHTIDGGRPGREPVPGDIEGGRSGRIPPDR